MENGNILISVVIPLYNKAHTIVKTVDTVFAQTYQNFEIVIVDDGSTDNGVQIICDNFNDSRIRIVRQKNSGVSAARNRGVDEAKGEYVAFLDGDDEWHPNYLETMLDLTNQYPSAGLFLCGGLVQNANGCISIRIAKGYEGYKGVIQLFQNPEVFSHTSATIVNRRLFNKTHRFIPGMCKFEDFLASQALALITEVVYCGLPLTKYVGGIEGQLTVRNRTNPKAEESVLLYYNQIVEDSINVKGNIDNSLSIYLKYNIRHLFKTYIQSGNIGEIEVKWSAFSKTLRDIFPFNEIRICKMNPHLYELYINMTKLVWRLHGFPRMLQSINPQKIDNNLLNW